MADVTDAPRVSRLQVTVVIAVSLLLIFDSNPDAGLVGYNFVRLLAISAGMLFFAWKAVQLKKLWPLGFLATSLVLASPFIVRTLGESWFLIDWLITGVLCALVFSRVFMIREDPFVRGVRRFWRGWRHRQWWDGLPEWVKFVGWLGLTVWLVWQGLHSKEQDVLWYFAMAVVFIIATVFQWLMSNREVVILAVFVALAYWGLVQEIRRVVKEAVAEALGRVESRRSVSGKING